MTSPKKAGKRGLAPNENCPKKELGLSPRGMKTLLNGILEPRKRNLAEVIDLNSNLNPPVRREWNRRMKKRDIFQISSDGFQNENLQDAVADFFNRQFKPQEIIKPEQVRALPNMMVCLESLLYCLFRKCEKVLIPAPFHTSIDLTMSAGLKDQLVPWCPDKSEENGTIFTISPALLEEKLIQIKKTKTPIKGIILFNPNPMGEVYSRKILKELLSVCSKYELEVIFVESFALSHFDLKNEFVSLLSLNAELPDPEKTHFVCGFGKDIGLPEIDCGFIHTKKPLLLRALGNYTKINPIAALIKSACIVILKDKKWLDDFFLPFYKTRLLRRHRYASKKFRQLGLNVRPSSAGLVLWVDFGVFLEERTRRHEMVLCKEMKRANLFITPGTILNCGTPGWFKICIVGPKNKLDEGISRMANILMKKKELEKLVDEEEAEGEELESEEEDEGEEEGDREDAEEEVDEGESDHEEESEDESEDDDKPINEEIGDNRTENIDKQESRKLAIELRDKEREKARELREKEREKARELREKEREKREEARKEVIKERQKLNKGK